MGFIISFAVSKGVLMRRREVIQNGFGPTSVNSGRGRFSLPRTADRAPVGLEPIRWPVVNREPKESKLGRKFIR